jgi:hypothetical protein
MAPLDELRRAALPGGEPKLGSLFLAALPQVSEFAAG